MDDYKIKLGVELDTSDIISEINKAEGKVDPIKIKVDAETKELTKSIQDALRSLSSGTKNALTLDTSKLEASLNDVTSTIREIKSAIGSLDSGSGMKSLVSSINSISTALDKASNKFDELVGDLKSLSGKDFNLNFGINMGGSNPIARQTAYGNKARSETLPQLKQQMSALVKYYNDTYKESADEIVALQRLVSGTKLNTGDFFQSFMFGKDSVASRMGSGSLSSQMQAYKQYIDMFKQAASLKGLDISSVTSQFSKSADQLVQDAQDIQTGAKEMDESFDKLKQIFGGGSNLNIEGLSAQLDPIIKDLTAIREAVENLSKGVSIDGLTSSFDRLSDSIEKLVQNANQVKVALGDGLTGVVDVDTGEVKQIEGDLKKVTASAENAASAMKQTATEAKKLNAVDIGDVEIKGLDGSIDSLKNALRGLNLDDSAIEDIIGDLDELNVKAKSVSATFKDGSLVSLDVKGTDGLKNAVSVMKTYGDEAQNTSVKITQTSNAVEKIKDKLKELKSGEGNTKFDVEIGDVEDKINRLSGGTVELREKLDLLQQEFKNIQAASAANDIDALIAANERYENVLQDVNNQLKLQRQNEQQTYGKESLNLKKQAASLDIDDYLENNTRAARELGDEFRRLQREINACDDSKAFTNLKRQVDNLKRQVDINLDGRTQSFGDRFKKQWQQYSSYLSVASLFQYAEQGLRSMFEQVKLIDSAMTELKKVTNETDASYNQFLSNAATRSREIGTTIDGLVSSTADFARLGYDFVDAQGLAEVANIYAVVGDEIEGVEGATESLISTMAAFKDEANNMSNTDFAMSIVDKFNEIGNNFAISSGGIGEALERSASSLMAANNTIDESIALITAANTVVQHPEAVGTAFKTISMRIRGAKTELEEAGLETDGMVDSTAKLREEIMALSGVDIMLDSQNFKSTYQIMDELAQKWEDLTDIQQAKCLPDNVEIH